MLSHILKKCKRSCGFSVCNIFCVYYTARYEGEYVNGVKEGKGTFWYPDGSKYEGEWKSGIRNGMGKYTYPNGDWYDGSWKSNLKDGNGIYYHSQNDVKYKGLFESRKTHKKIGVMYKNALKSTTQTLNIFYLNLNLDFFG